MGVCTSCEPKRLCLCVIKGHVIFKDLSRPVDLLISCKGVSVRPRRGHASRPRPRSNPDTPVLTEKIVKIPQVARGFFSKYVAIKLPKSNIEAMAANVAPVSYALVAKKAAGTSEDNDSSNIMSEIPANSENLSENAVRNDKKKRNRRNKAKKAAQKALLEAEAEKVPNSAESTEIDEPVQTVFIDAPPPKVNVWLKKSDNPTSSQQQSSAQESSQDENMEKEPTPGLEAPEVKTGLKTTAVTNSNAPNLGTKTTATKEEQPPNSAAIMKESTADNRPHPQQQKENLASIPVTSQTKVKVQASTKPSAKSSGGKSGFPWKTPTQTAAP